MGARGGTLLLLLLLLLLLVAVLVSCVRPENPRELRGSCWPSGGAGRMGSMEVWGSSPSPLLSPRTPGREPGIG
jgi:hypothetical protein